MGIQQYQETIYAGVLGKILGVYLGRPVEGWSYENINRMFGEIEHYKNDAVGAPLIVPDDDISGTFAFIRALEDWAEPRDISAREIGETWLDYIIENKTILWWGGLSRSTEHTAYLRLKNGIPAPESGSAKRNGRSMAEQIGAEIFIDTWALVNPNDPEQAVSMARKAASVSHDGIAVEAACYLAAMESMAFSEKRVPVLIEQAKRYVSDAKLLALIDELVGRCAEASDWRTVREWIAKEHGYDKYPGNCPMITNHLALLMAFCMGGDDFNRSISIATSAGWDTDCNSGNVGCLNGIRLGLNGIDAGADLRGPVRDRLYVVTSDGGACISDAVRETNRLLNIGAMLRGEECLRSEERYTFLYPGSVQGFYPDETAGYAQALTELANASVQDMEGGLFLRYRHLARGSRASVCVDTFTDMKPKGKEGTSYFDVLASPALYSTQTVKAMIICLERDCPNFRFFVDYYTEKDHVLREKSDAWQLREGENMLSWQVPHLGGNAIYRLGIELASERRMDGQILLKTLDWSGAPSEFSMGKAMTLSPSLTPWTTETTWLKGFVSSAEQFYPDYTTTFSVSHPVAGGVVTTGTSDWKDYAVSSAITFSQQNAAGLVIRAKGHRQYYSAGFSEGCAIIRKHVHGEITELCKRSFPYEIDHTYALCLQAKGTHIALAVDGVTIVEAKDHTFISGGAGFFVDTGAILADGFVVEAL